MTRLARAADLPTASRGGMMTAPARLSDTGYASQADVGTEPAGMSPGKFSAKRAALTYRQHFAACWQQFVTDNFESPEHAAMVFGVDASTARKWFEGSHAPSGFAVGYAYAMSPEAASAALTVRA